MRRKQQLRRQSIIGTATKATALSQREADTLEGSFCVRPGPGEPVIESFPSLGAAHEAILGLQRLLAKELAYAADWLDEELRAHPLWIHFDLARTKIRDDTLAGQLRKLLLELKPGETSDAPCSVAGDKVNSGLFSFRFKAYWEPVIGEARHIDKRTQAPHNQANIDPLAVVVDETRDGPSPSPSEREGSDMGGRYSTDARLLFETVKTFRAIRDCHRLSRLASALNLTMPPHKAPTIQEVEKLINRLGGKSFGSFEANHMAAQEIQGLLNDLGLRVACPRPKCGQPASLYHRSGGRARNGVFVFVHAGTQGSNYHGGLGELPEMRLMRAAPTSNKLER